MIVSPTSRMPCGPISARYTPAVMVHRPVVVPVKSRERSRLTQDVSSQFDQREAQALAVLGAGDGGQEGRVLGQPAWFVAAGQEAAGAPAVLHVDAQGLHVAAGDVGAVAAGRLEQPQRDRVDAHDAERTGLVGHAGRSRPPASRAPPGTWGSRSRQPLPCRRQLGPQVLQVERSRSPVEVHLADGHGGAGEVVHLGDASQSRGCAGISTSVRSVSRPAISTAVVRADDQS